MIKYTFDNNISTEKKPYDLTPFEIHFQQRYQNAMTMHETYRTKWQKIENCLFRRGWEAEDLITHQDNLLLNTLTRTLGEFDTSSFQPSLNAIGDDPENKIADYDKVIKAEWQRLQIAKNQPEIIRDSLICGFGISHIYYDPEEMIGQKKIGVIKNERISPYHFYPDPNATKVEEADYFVIRQTISVMTLFNHPKIKDNTELKLKILHNWNAIEGSQDRIVFSDYILKKDVDGLLVQVGNRQVDLFTYYYRVIDENNQMVYRVSMIAGNSHPVLIDDRALKVDFFPFSIYWFVKEQNTLYGKPFLEQAYFFQLSLDDFSEASSRILHAFKYPMLMIPESANIKTKELSYAEDKLISGEKLFKVIQLPPTVNADQIKFLNSREVFADIQQVAYQKSMQAKEALNLTGINTSADLGSLVTTGGVQAAQQQAAKYYSHSKIEVSRFCEKLTKIILWFIKTYYTENRSFNYSLDKLEIDFESGQQKVNPSVNSIQMKGSEIDLKKIQYEIRVDALTKSEKEKQAYNLIQLFQISRQYRENPNTLIKESDIVNSFDIPNKKKILNRAILNQYENRLKSAEQTFAVSRQGILLQVLEFFKVIQSQITGQESGNSIFTNSQAVQQLAVMLFNFMQVEIDVMKAWNATEQVDVGAIIQTIANMTYLEVKN